MEQTYHDHMQNWHISEAGLARVMARLEAATDAALLTAYRFQENMSKAEAARMNIIRNRQLRQTLNARRLGSYELVGQWYETREDGSRRGVTERALLVIKNPDISRAEPPTLTFGLAKKHKREAPILKLVFNDPDPRMSREEFQAFIFASVKEYNQDAAILKEDDSYAILHSDGRREAIGDKITLNRIEAAYSRFVRKMDLPFVFEGVFVPLTISARMVAKIEGFEYPVLDDAIQRGEKIRRQNYDDIYYEDGPEI